jgi:hypothetical protein
MRTLKISSVDTKETKDIPLATPNFQEFSPRIAQRKVLPIEGRPQSSTSVPRGKACRSSRLVTPQRIDSWSSRCLGVSAAGIRSPRDASILHCLAEEALGCRNIAPFTQQEVYRSTLLIDCAIQVGPTALHLDINKSHHNAMTYPLAESIDSSASQIQEQSVGPDAESSCALPQFRAPPSFGPGLESSVCI